MNPEDFQSFYKGNETPPAALGQVIKARVHHELNPSALKVFSKLALIHFAVGALTLAVCPQFGVRLLGDGLGLMGTFMHLGSLGCPVACGIFFFSATLLVASLILNPEEVKSLRKNQILEVSALSLLSLGVFTMLHAEIVLGFALAWFLGALVGAFLSLEAGSRLRFRLVAPI